MSGVDFPFLGAVVGADYGDDDEVEDESLDEEEIEIEAKERRIDAEQEAIRQQDARCGRHIGPQEATSAIVVAYSMGADSSADVIRFWSAADPGMAIYLAGAQRGKPQGICSVCGRIVSTAYDEVADETRLVVHGTGRTMCGGSWSLFNLSKGRK